MHAALARSPESQRQPVGVHAAGPDTNCGPTFRARARRGAPPRRAAAPEEKNGPGSAQGEPDWPRRSTPKCSTRKTFFVGNLAKRVNPVLDHVDHEVFSLFTEAFLRVYPANLPPRRPGGAVAPRCLRGVSVSYGNDQVIRETPASRGTETSADVLVVNLSNAGPQQWYGNNLAWGLGDRLWPASSGSGGALNSAICYAQLCTTRSRGRELGLDSPTGPKLWTWGGRDD